MTRPPLVIAIEGIDGSGKNTLATTLEASLSDHGLAVSRVSFPRYEERPWGRLISDVLSGSAKGLSRSIEGTALAFAIDRHSWWQEARRAAARIWIVDRYVASNIAYGCGRLRSIGGDCDEFERWVLDLELSLLELPPPTLQILLDIAPEVPRQRMESRRPMDSFEQSQSLQEIAGAEYRRLANQSVISEWKVVSFGADASAADVYSSVAPALKDILLM